jgi:hypothetical protein
MNGCSYPEPPTQFSTKSCSCFKNLLLDNHNWENSWVFCKLSLNSENVCVLWSKHENPQWSWSCQGSSPVLPPYKLTFLLSSFGLLWVPLHEGLQRLPHVFCKHHLSHSHTGRNPRVLYWQGNGARKLASHPIITSWVVSASTWLINEENEGRKWNTITPWLNVISTYVIAHLGFLS